MNAFKQLLEKKSLAEFEQHLKDGNMFSLDTGGDDLEVLNYRNKTKKVMYAYDNGFDEIDIKDAYKIYKKVADKNITESFQEELNESDVIEFHKLRSKIADILNKNYSVSNGPFGSDPIIDYYASDLNVGVDEIITLEGTTINIEITTYYDDEEFSKSDANKNFKNFMKELTKAVESYPDISKTELRIEDPEGSGYEGYGDYINVKLDIKPLLKKRIDYELKNLEKTSIVQIIKNADISDIIAFMLDEDFCKEVEILRSKSRVSAEDIRLAYS